MVGGAMSRQCHTPATSRHAPGPLKPGSETGGGGVSSAVSRRRVMLVDGVGRGRTHRAGRAACNAADLGIAAMRRQQ